MKDKVVRFSTPILGSGVVVVATILWLYSDFRNPLFFIIATCIGVAMVAVSYPINCAYETYAEEREKKLKEIARQAAEFAEKREAEEKEAVFDSIVLSVATPARIEGALRWLVPKRPEFAEQLGILLAQFDKAHGNLKSIRNFATSNERYADEIASFENALTDVATNSTAVINAFKLGSNIEKTLEKIIRKNQLVLDSANTAMTAILKLANHNFAERKKNPSVLGFAQITDAYKTALEARGGEGE